MLLLQIALLLLLLSSPSLQTSITGPTTAGGKYIQQGAAGGDQFPQWEISYFAVNYLPICGVSMEIEGGDYWSNSIECGPAMSRFSKTSASVSTFDTSGIEIKQVFGGGTQFCMCYTVAHTSGSFLDVCLLVGGSAEIRIRDGVAVGIQSPQSNSKKALPQCKDVDTTSYISNSPTTTAPNGATPTSGSGNANAPSTAATASNLSSSGKQGQGLSTESIIGLSVGLPGAFVAIGTLIGFCCKTRRRQVPAPGFT